MNKEIKYPLESENLLLCPYESGFINEYADLMTRPETHKYNYTKPQTRDKAEQRLAELCAYDYAAAKGRLELAIVEKGSGLYIGYVGFKDENTPPWSSTEIFYTLHPDCFGRGYGTEAVGIMLDFGFRVLGFHRIQAGATVENTASWKIMEKLGMWRESHWIQDRPRNGAWDPANGFAETGKWDDGYGYAITAEEYFRRHESTTTDD